MIQTHVVTHRRYGDTSALTIMSLHIPELRVVLRGVERRFAFLDEVDFDCFSRDSEAFTLVFRRGRRAFLGCKFC